MSLAPVGMDRLDIVARLAQATARGIGPAARAREHDHAVRPLLGEDRLDERRLNRLRRADDVLVDGLGDVALTRDLDFCGIFHHRRDDVVDGRVDGRGEQKRLPVFRRRGDNLLHGRQKAHVEHAVGLVEHEDLDVAELHRLALHQVDEATGRRDEHVASALEAVNLRIVRKSADDGRHAMVRRKRHLAGDVADLLRKLARRRHDEHERTRPIVVAPEPVHGRQRERSSLSRSRLGARDDVAPLQGKWNRLFLNGRRLLEAHALHSRQGLLRQAQILKRCHVRLSFRRSAPDKLMRAACACNKKAALGRL